MLNDDSEIYMKRDLMLGEIYQSTKNTEKTLEAIKTWCDEHDKKDDKRFLIGAVALIVVAFTSGVLPELLKFVRIGG